MSDLDCTNRIIFVQILVQKFSKLRRSSMVGKLISMTDAIRYSYFFSVVADLVVFTAAVEALVIIVGAAATAAAVAAFVVVTVYNACVLLFIVVATAAMVNIVAFVTIVFAITVAVVVSKESASHPFQLSPQLDAPGDSGSHVRSAAHMSVFGKRN